MATFNQTNQVVMNQTNVVDVNYISLFLGMYLLNKEIPNWLWEKLAEMKFNNANEWNIYAMIEGAPSDSKELRSLILSCLVKRD